MPKLTFVLEITEAEQANLLARLTGTVGNSLSLAAVDGAPVAAGDDDAGPADAAAPAVDARGIPWNGDYHASTKARNADGTWRTKRGVDKAKLEAWEKTLQPSTFTLPASLAGTQQPVQLPNPNAGQPVAAIPGFTPAALSLPDFTPPQAAPADIPVTMEDINAAFGKLSAAGVIAADGSNLMPIYQQLQITDPNQIATDETIRRRLRDALRATFPTVDI